MDVNGSDSNEPLHIDELEFLEEVPAGAYQVDKDGNFLYCNHEAARILGYKSPQELMEINIYDLYFDREFRHKVLNRMRKAGGKFRTYITWRKKDGSEILVNDFAEFIYEDDEVVGVRGIFVEATYEQLFDDLNAGTYIIGADQKTITSVNKAVARIFGFESPEDMRGIDISQYYRHHEDYAQFMKDLKEKEQVENYPLEMKRKDGEPITISVSCRLEKNEKGDIVGRKGTFTDVTEQQRYRKLLEQPLGVYEVRMKNNKPIIIFCNETFAEMFGRTSEEDIIDMNIQELYANKDDVSKFDNALRKADEKDEPINDYLLKVKKKKVKEGEEKEEEFWIKIFCYPIENDEGEIIGRKGTVIDVSDRIELERIMQTRIGIQRFIHGFIAPMMSIHSTSQVVAKEVERGVDIKYGSIDMDRIREKKHNILALFEEIKTMSENLVNKIEEIIALCKAEKAFEDEYINDLILIADEIKKEMKNVIKRIIELRKLHKDAYSLLSDIQSHVRAEKNITDSKRITDKIRMCFVDLDELDSIYVMYLTQSILNKSKIAYHDVEGLRQLMMRIGEEEREQKLLEFNPANIIELIDRIIDMYRIDASLKGINIHSPRGKIPYIEVSPNHMERMFSYIIQNAVKYSFKRDGYIDVVVADNGATVQIDVENYGVGILPDEIKSDKIFEYGFRGKFSRDRNRTGSGIGLSETKRIAEAHGGRVRVESIPVGFNGKITHNTPHKTTISVILPKKQNRR
jgi:PAS domain S-box-containing protein